jgi:hypothetical protein
MKLRLALLIGLGFATSLSPRTAKATECVRTCATVLSDAKGCCLAASTPVADVTTAPYCRATQLAFEAWTSGAAGSVGAELWIRNVSEKACQVSGAPRVELVDRKGRVIQSTLLKGRNTRPKPIVLAAGAFAHADLGIIASNVCGGDQSDFLVLVTGGVRRRIAFSNGGPLMRQQCEGDALRRHARPHPGELKVGAYEAFDQVTQPPG